MLQEYFEVVERNNLIEKLARKREENANIAQGAGALGPDASTEQPVVEPSRVVTASLHITDFADGMGRILAQGDFHKLASSSFQKEALSLGGIGAALIKRPGAIGAATGAVGGAIAGGPDHRISGALGGAALGAAGTHAGVGIGKRMIQRGQGFGTAAKNYGTEVSRKVNSTVGSFGQIRQGEVPIHMRGQLRTHANPDVVAQVPGKGVGRAGWSKPAPAATQAAGQVSPAPAAAVASRPAGQVSPAQAPITPGPAVAQNAQTDALARAKQQRVNALGSRVDASMAAQNSPVSSVQTAPAPTRVGSPAGQVAPAQAASAGQVAQPRAVVTQKGSPPFDTSFGGGMPEGPMGYVAPARPAMAPIGPRGNPADMGGGGGVGNKVVPASSAGSVQRAPAPVAVGRRSREEALAAQRVSDKGARDEWQKARQQMINEENMRRAS